MAHQGQRQQFDRQAIQRLDRAYRYLGQSQNPDVVYALATAPTDWDEMDDQIRTLGGNPNYGMGITDLLESAGSYQAPRMTVGTIRQLQGVLTKEGFLDSERAVPGQFDNATRQALRVFDDFQNQERRRGKRPGAGAAEQWLGYMTNVLPSKVWQGLAGLAKHEYRTYIEPFHTRDESNKAADVLLTNEKFVAPFRAAAERGYAESKVAVKEAQKKKDLRSTLLNWVADIRIQTGASFDQIAANPEQFDDVDLPSDTERAFDAALAVAPELAAVRSTMRGARIAKGIAKAPRGAFIAQEGARGVGLTTRYIRKRLGPEDMLPYLDDLGQRKVTLRGIGEQWVSNADALARAKSTPAGQAVTALVNGTTQTSLTARAAGAVGGGEVFPNIPFVGGKDQEIKGLSKSALSRAIDDTPALGHAINWGPFGEGRAFGNPVDLTAFVWYPTEALPLRIRDIRNGVSQMVPINHTRPVSLLTGLNREQLTVAAGDTAQLSQGMRYWRLESAVHKRAHDTVMRKGIKPEAGIKYEDAMVKEMQKEAGRLKGNNSAISEAIASVDDADVSNTFQYIFKDNPELLARRGQGEPVLENWFRANRALMDVPIEKVSVDKFVRGGGLWSEKNRPAIEAGVYDLFEVGELPTRRGASGEIVRPTTIAGELPDPSTHVFTEAMKKRLGQTLDPKAVIGIRRADNPLSSAQQLGAWSGLFGRLFNIRQRLESGLRGAGVTARAERAQGVLVPKAAQVNDFQAAGFANEEIDLFRRADRMGIQGGSMDRGQAERLLGSVSTRIDELRTTANRFHEETAGMSDLELGKRMRGKFFLAGRDVTLADKSAAAELERLGYVPIAMQRNTLTLRDVDPGNIAETLGEASRLAPVMDFLGLSNKPIETSGIASIRGNFLRNELAQIGHEEKLAKNGDELLGQLRETAERTTLERSGIKTPSVRKKVWNTGAIFDLRQLTASDLERYGPGWTRPQARRIHDAVGRGVAFGFDMAHPWSTRRNLGTALQLEGIPGFEDALRTLTSVRGRLPAKVQGPAGLVLNLPDTLARVRDWVQFSLSPLFTVGNMVEAKLIRGSHDLPFAMRPRVELDRLAKNWAGGEQEFNNLVASNYAEAAGARGRAYAAVHDTARETFGTSGFFGYTTRDAEALDAWLLKARGTPTKEVGRILDEVYRYPTRSALERSVNYIVFPFSFNLKLTRNLSYWFLDSPSRILMVNTALKYYEETIDKDEQITELANRYLPVLKELNKINTFARGFQTVVTPVGGRNITLVNLAKAAVPSLKDDERLGAFIPVGFADGDVEEGMQTILKLLPFYRQLTPLIAAGVQQGRILGLGRQKGEKAGTQEWQVDNYYQEMNALKTAVGAELARAGKRPSMSSLYDPFGRPNPTILPEFFDAVQADIGEVERKYPLGASYAKRLNADYSVRGQELQEMARHDPKPREEAMVLYLDANIEILKAKAEVQAPRMTPDQKRFAYAAQASQVAQGLPIWERGDLTEDNVEEIRRMAGLFAHQEPKFQSLYKRYFEWEFGPLTVVAPPPGTRVP